MDQLVKQLWPVQPVVAAIQLRPQQCRVIPGIYRQTGQVERVAGTAGPSENCRNTGFEPQVLQNIRKETGEVLVFFRECERVSEGLDRSPKPLLDDFLGIAQLVIYLLRTERAKIGMGDGVRAEADTCFMQFTHLPPG